VVPTHCINGFLAIWNQQLQFRKLTQNLDPLKDVQEKLLNSFVEISKLLYQEAWHGVQSPMWLSIDGRGLDFSNLVLIGHFIQQ